MSLPEIDVEKARKWAASPEGQKSLSDAFTKSQEGIDLDKQRQKNLCMCCYCRANRGF